jgi:hypothetical protein
MPKQELHGSQVASAPINKRRFGPPFEPAEIDTLLADSATIALIPPMTSIQHFCRDPRSPANAISGSWASIDCFVVTHAKHST